MNLTKEQLETVEQMAYRLFTPDMIALNIGVPEIDFKMALQSPSTCRTAFYRGVIRQEMELREALIKATQNGSNPALVELMKLLKQQRNALYD